MSLPAYSKIVICGGGIAGASVAYHLTQLGNWDITLLERHQLTSGTTWHAAGLIMQLRSSHALTELAKYNVELYRKLESETDRATGFKQNGTLGICRTKERFFETKRTASIAKSFGIEAHIISPYEAKQIYPPLDVTQIQGAIYLVQGRDSCEFLQKLCTSDINVPIGKIVYTHMLNNDGGIEVDATVNRLDECRFLIVTSATSAPREFKWIQKHITDDKRVHIMDLTASYAVLSIQGPNSRKLMSRLTAADVSEENFPYTKSKTIELGYGLAICNRLTFIGEMGWEIFIATEFAQHILDLILDVGSTLGLKPAGYHALEHLRCEAGYREFDLDLTPQDTPFEAGLGFTVDFSKSINFFGREALELKRKKRSLTKRLVQFQLLESEVTLFGEEIIWLNNKIVGYLSSGAFSFTLGTSVGMGYVFWAEGLTNEIIQQANWEIEVACLRHPAKASLRPFVKNRSRSC